MRSAIVASTVANVHRDPKKQPLGVDVFMPYREADRQAVTPERPKASNLDIMRGWFAHRIIRKSKPAV